MTETRESLIRQLLHEAMAIKAWQATFGNKPLPTPRFSTDDPIKALRAISEQMTLLWTTTDD